ncbi:GDSL esterase/lipase At1g71691-like [Solanum pennellii]|uniref:GDSL esterase/lipase At1g71691-like n=1 Tax=Solanum pennellii TaxID=28526 RepID=A0ABM1FJQ5_SOLPN|nr:GDSL esterase/lipase At1g71691-like [Solanum pennellii]
MAKFIMFFMIFTISSVVGDGDYAYDYDDAYAPASASTISVPAPPPASTSPVPTPTPVPTPPSVPTPPPVPAPAPAVVPALFAFGDSLIDSGNNNQLFSFAKANYLPYGIDVGGPTGRFSNGYTILDQIGVLLGLPLLPSYSEEFNVDTMRYGVNYASAAAGILDVTGFHFVERIPFSYQIKNFENTLVNLIKNLSAPVVKEAIPKCIFFVGMGNNDYLNNYIMPAVYFSQDQYSPQKFAELLIHQYKAQLLKLYDLGARKFIISGIGQMGCIPSMLAETSGGGCSETVNEMVHPFNSKLRTMIIKLNKDLAGAHLIFLDMEYMFKDIFKNHKAYGFSVIDRGCCGLGKNQGEVTCLPFEIPCANRDEYLFWDAYHPTSAVNLLLGRMAFYNDANYSYPINIQHLALI